MGNPCTLMITWESRFATPKSLQSCPTLCDPIDINPPSSPAPGIFQARTLEWVAISFSNAWKWKGKVKLLSRVRLLATPWTAAYQAPPPMGFSRQEYWSGESRFASPQNQAGLLSNKTMQEKHGTHQQTIKQWWLETHILSSDPSEMLSACIKNSNL